MNSNNGGDLSRAIARKSSPAPVRGAEKAKSYAGNAKKYQSLSPQNREGELENHLERQHMQPARKENAGIDSAWRGRSEAPDTEQGMGAS